MAEEFLVTIQALIAAYALNIVIAIVIFAIGWWVAGVAGRFVKKLMTKANIDPGLVNFTGSVVNVGVIVFVGMAALERMGIATTSFIAVLGALGLAIGFALQGALSNFAAGALMLIFRPIKVGDMVEVAGTFGHVEEIQIFNTVVLTPDNKTVIIPNGQITAASMVNYSTKGLIRIDMVFGIGYGDDLLKAKRVLEEIIVADDRVVKDPAPAVTVMELADNSVNFAFRPFVDPELYWGVYFDMTERVKLRFDAEGISIPFPQRDIHVFQNKLLEEPVTATPVNGH